MLRPPSATAVATVLLLVAGCVAAPTFEVASVVEDGGASGADGASRHDGDADSGREAPPTADDETSALPDGEDRQATTPDDDEPRNRKSKKRPCDPPDPECDDD